jgi:hypothetical protein
MSVGVRHNESKVPSRGDLEGQFAWRGQAVAHGAGAVHLRDGPVPPKKALLTVHVSSSLHRSGLVFFKSPAIHLPYLSQN